MIKFSVSRVEKEPVLLDGTEGPAFWALPGDDQFAADSPVSYSLKAVSAAGAILVSGRVSGRVSTRCGRCLAPMTLSVVNDGVELCYPKSDIADEELDITADIREELLIELPMNPLCREDCKGLCPVCGTDRNKKKCHCRVQGNPAWSALDNLNLPETEK